MFNKFIVLLFNLIDIYESLNPVVNVEGVGMMRPWSLILTEVENTYYDSELTVTQSLFCILKINVPLPTHHPDAELSGILHFPYRSNFDKTLKE